MLDGGEAVGLVDGYQAQPREYRVALGLRSQEDRPRGLAGVLDELARRTHEVRDGAVQRAVMLAVELLLVTARRRPPQCRGGGGFGRGLHEPRPG